MKDIFDIKRFLRYAMVRYSERKLFFFVPLFLIVVAIFLILFNAIFEKQSGVTTDVFQFFISFLGFFIMITVYSLEAFSGFQKTKKGFMLAIIPASTFEKFLYGLLCSTIVFTLLYLIAFFASAFLISEYNILVDAQSSDYRFYRNPLFLSTLGRDFRDDFIYCNPFKPFSLVKMVLSVSSVYLAGSIFFRRLGFLFTTIISIAFIYLSVNIIATFLGSSGYIPLGTASELFMLPFMNKPHYFSETGIIVHISEMVLFISVFILWIATYNRLKEKEY